MPIKDYLIVGLIGVAIGYFRLGYVAPMVLLSGLGFFLIAFAGYRAYIHLFGVWEKILGYSASVLGMAMVGVSLTHRLDGTTVFFGLCGLILPHVVYYLRDNAHLDVFQDHLDAHEEKKKLR